MADTKNLIVHNPDGLDLFPLKSLNPLQRDYKSLSNDGRKKMQKSFEEHGFSFAVKIWIDKKGIAWIIAGHQRTKVVKSYKTCTVVSYTNTSEGLIEISRDDYEEIMLPCSLVHAENRKEAIQLLLLEDSRFGNSNKDTDLFSVEGISVDDIQGMAIHDLDLNDVFSDGIEIKDNEIQDMIDSLPALDAEEKPKEQQKEAQKEVIEEKKTFLPESAQEKYGRKIVNLTFTIPEEYAEKLEANLAQTPLTTFGNERIQNLRGRRLLKLVLGIDIDPI